MKTNILNLAAAALLIFAASSCNKEQIVNTGDGTKAVVLNLSFGDAGTKAFEPGTPYKDNYKTFDVIDIYFTNASGTVLKAWHAEKDADEGTEDKVIWDGLIGDGNSATAGVKFMGLSSDVTGVYVVANGSKIDEGANISTVCGDNMQLISYGPDKEQSEMPYVGGDNSLDVLDVSRINEDAGTIPLNAKDEGIYMHADIHLRPAVSRFEVHEIGAKVSGILYYTMTDGKLVKQIWTSEQDIPDGMSYYEVVWDNFEVNLVGAYMSNVYRAAKLFPVSNDATAWINDGNLFATPSFENGQSPISQGMWTELQNESALNKILAYNNHNGSTYDNLVEGDYVGTTDIDNVNWLYKGGNKDGNNSGVIPFNFFVPYNVTDDAKDEQEQEIDELENTEYPVLHFQFTKSNAEPQYSYTVTYYDDKSADGTVISVDNEIYKSFNFIFGWNVVPNSESTMFANVVKFTATKGTTEELVLKPGYIYRLKNVIIDPSILSTTPSDDDTFNVYVEVEVIPFHTREVYPIFD